MNDLHKRGGDRPQGFAAMDETKHREATARGGKRAHQLGRANKFTSGQARQFGSRVGRPRSGQSLIDRVASLLKDGKSIEQAAKTLCIPLKSARCYRDKAKRRGLLAELQQEVGR